ncbi:MAG: hypothetical protein GF308_15535 [Candidatus Heimdallarchaeota archaeon]|nr:hypothetical protein [Candidatus Heimdallarchaeota archaeon]
MDQLVKYFVPPYRIHILKDSSGRQYYSPSPAFETSRYFSLTNAIERKILSQSGFLDTKVIRLQSLFSYLEQAVKEQLANYSLKAPSVSKSFFIDWMVYRIVGLEEIMPLLLDDYVQEIYLDKPNTSLYLDHQDFGRCVSDVNLSDSVLERLKTRLCLEKDAIINYLNPSLKVDVQTDKFHIRATMDAPPLASEGISLNVRKLRKKIWTLPELIDNKMLSIEAAAYLFFIMHHRKNITIIGEPGTGKTTLANAIDLLTPSQWRKITIEDVIESIDQSKYNKFQTRFVVSPFEAKNSRRSKSEEIIKLLHRSPSWVYLGEIQTAEHSRALFEALSAGLVGIQTCHGRTIELMLMRWVHQHEISLASLLSLDLLISVSSSFNDWKIVRKVNRLSEIPKDLCSSQIFNKIDEIQLIDIFTFCPKKQSLTKQIDLFETPLVKTLRKSKNLSRNEFEKELEFISNLLNYLIEKKIFDPSQLVNLFNNLTLKQVPFDLDNLGQMISKPINET